MGIETVFLDFRMPNGTTWFYLSFLLALAVFFRWSRFFSLRNLDLVAIFFMVPGLLATSYIEKQMLRRADGPHTPLPSDWQTLAYQGYVWLFLGGGILLGRCLLDLSLQRRPRLDPGLDAAGLLTLGIALFGFLMYETIVKEPDPAGRASAHVAAQLAASFAAGNNQAEDSQVDHVRTGIFMLPVSLSVETVSEGIQVREDLAPSDVAVGLARATAILCHTAILTALVLIGWRWFNSATTGLAMAILYLLLPQTALHVEKIDHLLPSVFLTWAVFCFRLPFWSGVMLGMAGVFFYPLFLLPLWTGFFWGRGARRFLIGFAVATVPLWLIIWWLEPLQSFLTVWISTMPWNIWDMQSSPTALSGIWTESTQFYRLPIFVLFMFVVAGIAFWPAEKNLGELIALSVALILGIQFWYPERGGTYVHWYLPLFLLMMFRPNLTDARPRELPVRETTSRQPSRGLPAKSART